LKGIIIPNLVEHIGHNAFRKCKSLIEIIIPENVKTIEELAFFECELLEKVVVLSRDLTDIGRDVFTRTHKDLTIYCYSDAEVLIEYAQAHGIQVEFLD